MRLDNGYPNVHYNQADMSYELWYGACVNGCGHQFLMYANSSDGLTWEKPDLGLLNLASFSRDFKHVGTKNNVVMYGGGIGIYKVMKQTHT